MSPSTNRLLAIAGLAALAGVAAAQPQAQGAARLTTVRDYVAQSDLVFHGEVVRIEYVNSLPAADAPAGIPYTIVTYRADHVLRGQVPGPEIALRFLGGYDPSTDTYLAASLSPQFDIGDEDILFVRGNGVSSCPLVGNREGRLRVSGGQVYTDSGREVTLDAAGRLVLGERYSLPEVGSVDVLGHTLWIGFDPEALMGQSGAVAGPVFTDAVARAAAAIQPPAAPFVSVEARQAFESHFPSPTPMRESVTHSPLEVRLDEATIAEILADESGLAEEYLARLEAAKESGR